MATRTIVGLNLSGIQTITRPANSPDLNSIKDVRNQMKEFIKRRYYDFPDGKKYSYDELHIVVRQTWNSTIPQILANLVESILRRYQAVTDACSGF